MIIMYTSPGCASCRKAKQWLQDHNIEFKEKNIFSTLLKEEEIKNLLMRSENGSEDIISKRSKIILEQKIDVEAMSTSELIRFIQKNPSVLKRPIMIDDSRFVVGYDDDEITTFIPSELRNIISTSCSSACPNYERCGEVRKPITNENEVSVY